MRVRRLADTPALDRARSWTERGAREFSAVECSATRRSGVGLRARFTLVATALVAAVAGVLVWLGWMLAGSVVSDVPKLPRGSIVRVDGVAVRASQLGSVLAENAQQTELHAGLIAFGCVVAAAAILAWALSGRLLRPVREVTGTARRLSADSLGERIRLPGPRDEVADLADTFDQMLDRLQSTFDSQRRFVANASHELRTPLSVMRTELDVTLADENADVAELRRMAEVLADAAERASALVEALLLLARTEGSGLATREPVDLAELARSAFSAVRAATEERGISPEFNTVPATVVGDPALLERVAGNLLENAVRHNTDGGWLTVATEVRPGWTMLRVASSGPALDADRVAELFEPFHRGGVDRTAQRGAGLGLSIVRVVVTAHGGDLHAEAVPGGGLAVEVSFPVGG
jgi:signal transduction histidine kinase